MTGDLISDAELADEFGMTLKQFHDKRQRQGWPHVRLGRFNIKFTAEQRVQILAMLTRAPAKTVAQKVTGQTERSARRTRSA